MSEMGEGYFGLGTATCSHGGEEGHGKLMSAGEG
jgi:hypothetical protein